MQQKDQQIVYLYNCIAVAGTSFDKVEGITDINSLVYIFDNQPRNKEVCSIMQKHINKNVPMVIWPQTIQEKDINDMVLAGRTPEQVKNIIDENTKEGIEAKLFLTVWRRC